jgi:hypothetical protein
MAMQRLRTINREIRGCSAKLIENDQAPAEEYFHVVAPGPTRRQV